MELSSSQILIPLKGLKQPDRQLIGGKAAVLAQLLDAGFPVPPALCLTTHAFRLALEPFAEAIEAELRSRELSRPAEAIAAAEVISIILVDLALPQRVARAINRALPELADDTTPLAVRSSAIAEDSAGASFAGQYETVLNVRGQAGVEAAILRCWRSFFSANALAALAAQGTLETDAMALIIQPLIQADCVGVIFSIDPVAQERHLAVVNATWGMGAGVVDGSVAADTYWVSRRVWYREAQVVRRSVVEKPAQLFLADGAGLARVPVPEEKQRAACLPNVWLGRLTEFAIAAENLFGRPQEVEWAVAGNRLWILQSRPLTGLPPELARTPPFPVEWQREADRRGFWFQGWDLHRTGTVVLPLERDTLAAWDRARWESARFGGSDLIQQARVINGWLYIGGTCNELSPGDLRVRQQAMRDLGRRLRTQTMTSWEYWGPEIVAATECLAAFDAEGADGPALAAHLEDAFGVYRRHWMMHAVVHIADLQPLVDAYVAVTGRPREAAPDEVRQLLQGEETKLTALIDALYKLATIARVQPAVAELVRATSDEAVVKLAQLPVAAAFWAELQLFLAEFGARNGDGYGSLATLATPTWQDRPAQVLTLVAAYLDEEVEPPAMARARRRQARDAIVDGWCASCEDQEAVATFRRHLDYARRQEALLEDHNHYIDQLSLGQLRLAALAAGRWLVKQALLAEPDEVFWLRLAEVTAALRGTAPVSPRATIAAHRAQAVQRAKLEPPLFLGVPDAALPERPPLTDEIESAETMMPAGVLRGQGASPGRYCGPARIVDLSVDLPNISPGDVLVAYNAGPRWTPIFPILGALVLDGGSLGQHAAATAREYGIPAVIAIGDATRRIRDGAIVMVDGTTGRVEIREP